MGYRNAPDEPGRPSRGASWPPRRSDIRARFARLRRDESGQSLALVLISMVLILGVSAFAVDVASWFVQRHHAQVSADAAALAAANCMANVGVSGNACTSATDTTDAKSVANNYANANGPAIQTVTVDTSARTVSVTTHTTGSLTFGGAVGISAPSITAHAVAAYGTVTLPSSVFAQDCQSPVPTGQLTTALTSPCTVLCSQAGIGIDANNITITGALATNGSINVKKNNGMGTDGDLLYGNPAASSCVSSNIGTDKLSTRYGINEEASFSYFPDTYYTALNAGTDCISQAALTAYGSSVVTIDTTNKVITFVGSIGTPSSLANIAICAARSTNWASGYSILVNQHVGLYGVTLTGPNISFASPANGITVEGDSNYTPDAAGESSPTLAIFDTTTTQATMSTANSSSGDTAGLVLGSATAGNNFSIYGAVWAPLGGIILPGNNGATGALIEANTTVLGGNNAGGGTPVTVLARGADQLIS